MSRRKPPMPTVTILDSDKERCLREEASLEKAIQEKGIYAHGISNYGSGFIARSGAAADKLPCIEVDGLLFFPPKAGTEISYENLCRFLEMMLQKGSLRLTADIEAEFQSE